MTEWLAAEHVRQRVGAGPNLGQRGPSVPSRRTSRGPRAVSRRPARSARPGRSRRPPAGRPPAGSRFPARRTSPRGPGRRRRRRRPRAPRRRSQAPIAVQGWRAAMPAQPIQGVRHDADRAGASRPRPSGDRSHFASAVPAERDPYFRPMRGRSGPLRWARGEQRRPVVLGRAPGSGPARSGVARLGAARRVVTSGVLETIFREDLAWRRRRARRLRRRSRSCCCGGARTRCS